MKRLALAVLGVWVVSSVCAAEIYRDEMEFLDAAPGVRFEGFEDLTAVSDFIKVTDPIVTDGFTMTHGSPGANGAALIVTDFANYGLGAVEGANYVAWQCGEGRKTMDIWFDEPVTAFGFSMTDALEVRGEINLLTDAGGAELVLSGAYPDGHTIFFGLVSEEPFSRVTLVGSASYDALGLDALYFGRVQAERPAVVEAGLDMTPDKMNRKSKGRWATAHITLPEGLSIADIDPETIAITALEGESGLRDYLQFADLDFTPVIEDCNDDGVPDLTVKFDRGLLLENLEAGDLAIAVEGDLVTGEHFIGVDSIAVK